MLTTATVPLFIFSRAQGRWVYYNDEKVAASKQPPFSLGYLYLYRRRE